MCFCVASIFRLLAQGKMDYKLGIAWTFVFGSVAALALAPRTLARMAAFLGIASPMNMLFFFGFLFSTGILFSLSRRTSRLQAQVQRLAQETAMRHEMSNDVQENKLQLR